MIKERADELVSALRSGEYKQGKFKLNRNDEHFCCLGVACELMYKKGLLEKTTQMEEEGGFSFPLTYYNGAFTYLPDSAMTYYGFQSNAGWLSEDTSLMSMNDSGRFSFEEIADVIEKNWEAL